MNTERWIAAVAAMADEQPAEVDELIEAGLTLIASLRTRITELEAALQDVADSLEKTCGHEMKDDVCEYCFVRRKSLDAALPNIAEPTYEELRDRVIANEILIERLEASAEARGEAMDAIEADLARLEATAAALVIDRARRIELAAAFAEQLLQRERPPSNLDRDIIAFLQGEKT